MNKILTVVIPTYNMENYLRKCLDSLIIDEKNLFDKLEVLVVNDELNNGLADQYRALADQEENVIFGGRLAEYKYYDMAPIVEKVLGINIKS